MECAPTTDDLFDTKTHPLSQPESPDYCDAASQAWSALAASNCAALAGLLKPETVAAMRIEAEHAVPQATYTKAWLNPYFSTPPSDVPESHPLWRVVLRCHGMIRADRFSPDGVIWSVFRNGDPTRFVAACLGYEKLHTYRDPYGCVNVNVQEPGHAFS